MPSTIVSSIMVAQDRIQASASPDKSVAHLLDERRPPERGPLTPAAQGETSITGQTSLHSGKPATVGQPMKYNPVVSGAAAHGAASPIAVFG
jgi:hypothetical protein